MRSTTTNSDGPESDLMIATDGWPWTASLGRWHLSWGLNDKKLWAMWRTEVRGKAEEGANSKAEGQQGPWSTLGKKGVLVRLMPCKEGEMIPEISKDQGTHSLVSLGDGLAFVLSAMIKNWRVLIWEMPLSDLMRISENFLSYCAPVYWRGT